MVEGNPVRGKFARWSLLDPAIPAPDLFPTQEGASVEQIDSPLFVNEALVPMLPVRLKLRAAERASYNGSIEASQASDVGSIPIARSINLVDSVALPLLKLEIGASWTEFWTQVGPKFFEVAPWFFKPQYR